MWRTPVDGGRARGFTLIELLVAMAVMALLMTASFGAVRIGNRVLESGIDSAGRTDRTRTVVNLLRRQFAQVVPIRYQVDGETLRIFSGDSTAIRFVAPAMQSDINHGLYLYALQAERNIAGATLQLKYAPFNPGQPDLVGDSRQQYELFENEDGFEFSYFGTRESDGGREWRDGWDSDVQALPDLVRISAVSPPTGADWSTLTFSVYADDRE